LLLGHAEQRGNRPAIREKSRGIWHTTSWRDLATEAGALAAALSARGVRRGSYVALVSDNRPHFYAAVCAAHGLGAVAVPLYQDASAEEIAALLKRAGATHVFAENQEQVDKLLSILPRCPSIACIVYDDDRGMRHYKQPQLASYAALLQQGRDLAASKGDVLKAEAARGNGGDPAFLIFTSGTTGPAKGAVLTHASLIDRARAAAAAEGISDADVAMAYLPPGWIGQNFFGYAQPMVTGCCVACPESSETMLADMRETGPTRFLAPPRVLETLLTQVSLRIEDAGPLNRALYRRAMTLAKRVGARILAGESVSLVDRLAYALYDLLVYGPLRDVLGLSRVRVAYTAGDIVHPDLLMYFRAIGVNLKQLYGSTETGFFVTMQPDSEVRPDTVGRVAAGVELMFTAEREILVRSPGLFSEYHGDPATTSQARNAEGWFRTGDAGYLGEDGHLRIIGAIGSVGALADGTPYAPKAVENRLKFQTYVREAVIFGAGRDRVCALIDIDPTTTGRWADRQSLSYTGHADLASLQEVHALIGECIAAVNAELALDAALAKSQIHRYVILRKELDADDGLLTRTGKLRRAAIAERFGALVDAMYAGGSEADGLRIGDAKTSAYATARKAA
jgi:long-chain acyl-CoA synthetase